MVTTMVEVAARRWRGLGPPAHDPRINTQTGKCTQRRGKIQSKILRTHSTQDKQIERKCTHRCGKIHHDGQPLDEGLQDIHTRLAALRWRMNTNKNVAQKKTLIIKVGAPLGLSCKVVPGPNASTISVEKNIEF